MFPEKSALPKRCCYWEYTSATRQLFFWLRSLYTSEEIGELGIHFNLVFRFINFKRRFPWCQIRISNCFVVGGVEKTSEDNYIAKSRWPDLYCFSRFTKGPLCPSKRPLRFFHAAETTTPAYLRAMTSSFLPQPMSSSERYGDICVCVG